LERLLLWRVWERLLEIEFVDRSIALAGKAFVSFFLLVIVVAAFVPEGVRASIVTTLIDRLGLAGEALTATREAFATSNDIREATGVLGLVLTIFSPHRSRPHCNGSTAGHGGGPPRLGVARTGGGWSGSSCSWLAWRCWVRSAACCMATSAPRSSWW
jgi:hypothetical protein